MGICTVQPIPLSKLPNASYSLPKPSLSRRVILTTPTATLFSRSIFLRNLLPRATPSEEISGGSSQFFNEKRDVVITLEEGKADDKKELEETVNEDARKELPEEGPSLSFDFLDKFNLDTNDTGSIVLYGGGVLTALWLTTAVVGAIDSIPLFPKLLEVVGLAYTVWFTSRYLLFKQSRDELSTKIEELKEQVFGSEDN
ncbi:protein CURVATURE THYLAKOID 1D, chloroplastic [Vigna unguiculata]|uniref:Glutamyl-tRNA synthetase n=1 Tax=Vigna unguiculata TaxID=3917 RepID=A0A4D6LQ34_VIGUN|nr:protein CURVATURE THYLAKOID 1D, chloroplastic [Vigna unguiculata]QCD90697.1 glutamyl-tRNA synthetase [Vigna unguiculata]